MPDNKAQAREHHAGLDNIRPDHSLDATHGRVDGSQRHQHKEGQKVDPQFHHGGRVGPGVNFISEDKNNGCNIESGAAGQGSGD